MNLRRNAIWLVPFLLTLTGPLWWGLAGRLLGPRSSGVGEQPVAAARQLNTFLLHRVALSQARNGVDDLYVEAEQVNSGKMADALEMLGVSGRMSGPERTVNFSGGTASYEPNQQVLTVAGRVQMETSDHYRLESEALRCLTASRQVESDQAVVLTGPGLSLHGRNFLYSLPTGDFRIGGRLTVDLS